MKVKLDSKNRMVIPKEVRRELNIKDGSFVDLKIRNGVIIVKSTIKPPKSIKEIENQSRVCTTENSEYNNGYHEALMWVLSKENN